MKARDSQTGQFKDVYVKALDSMPVGTIVDYDGQASDIPTGWQSYGTGQIRKTTETRPLTGTIVNEYNDSQVNAYSTQYINGINKYSTEETFTGKYWIDGKPIYRKVIECGSLPNNSGKHVLHNIANLNFFTNVKIWGMRSDKTTIFYPYYDVDTPANSVTTYLDATQIYLVTKSDRSSYTAYALLEYTKTTD